MSLISKIGFLLSLTLSVVFLFLAMVYTTSYYLAMFVCLATAVLFTEDKE